jgi:hypothetical protein
MYTSVVHTAEEIAHTLEVFERVMKRTVETASSSVRARL